MPPQQLERHYRDALQLLIDLDGRDGLGGYVEFGIGGGTSTMECIHKATGALGLESMRLFGFDSFEGLPDDGDYAGTSWCEAGSTRR